MFTKGATVTDENFVAGRAKKLCDKGALIKIKGSETDEKKVEDTRAKVAKQEKQQVLDAANKKPIPPGEKKEKVEVTFKSFTDSKGELKTAHKENEITVKELQYQLNQHQIDYDKKAKKPELFKLWWNS